MDIKNIKTSEWLKFLDDLFDGDKAVIAYVQVLFGRGLKQSPGEASR